MARNANSLWHETLILLVRNAKMSWYETLTEKFFGTKRYALISKLGEGGQAKVFKAKFHGKDVVMKYIPLDKVKHEYGYKTTSYGCNEFYEQEKIVKQQRCYSQNSNLDSILDPILSKNYLDVSKGPEILTF